MQRIGRLRPPLRWQWPSWRSSWRSAEKPTQKSQGHSLDRTLEMFTAAFRCLRALSRRRPKGSTAMPATCQSRGPKPARAGLRAAPDLKARPVHKDSAD